MAKKVVIDTERAIIKAAHAWHHWYCEVPADVGERHGSKARVKLVAAIYDDKRVKREAKR